MRCISIFFQRLEMDDEFNKTVRGVAGVQTGILNFFFTFAVLKYEDNEFFKQLASNSPLFSAFFVSLYLIAMKLSPQQQSEPRIWSRFTAGGLYIALQPLAFGLLLSSCVNKRTDLFLPGLILQCCASASLITYGVGACVPRVKESEDPTLPRDQRRSFAGTQLCAQFLVGILGLTAIITSLSGHFGDTQKVLTAGIVTGFMALTTCIISLIGCADTTIEPEVEPEAEGVERALVI